MITNYPSPIENTTCANITFSDSNNTSLNPAEDLGNLPAEPTQSQITAKLSDPKLSGDLFNSVNLPSTGKEGQVTTVVTKACHKMTENPVHKNIKHSTGHCTSNTVIKIILDSGSNGDHLLHEKGTEKHFPYLTTQVPKSWHMLNGSFLTKGKSKVSYTQLSAKINKLEKSNKKMKCTMTKQKKHKHHETSYSNDSDSS